MSTPSKNFSDATIFSRMRQFAKRMGRELAQKALLLFYAARRPETPAWAKTVIYGALIYLIIPTDTIPDFIPLTGYTDDLSTIAVALATVAIHVDDDVKQSANHTVNRWFGSSEEEG